MNNTHFPKTLNAVECPDNHPHLADDSQLATLTKYKLTEVLSDRLALYYREHNGNNRYAVIRTSQRDGWFYLEDEYTGDDDLDSIQWLKDGFADGWYD